MFTTGMRRSRLEAFVYSFSGILGRFLNEIIALGDGTRGLEPRVVTALASPLPVILVFLVITITGQYAIS